MKLKHYFFAGLDFMIDKNGKIYFIEANAKPAGAITYKRIYKKNKVRYELAKLIQKYKNPCVFYSKKDRKMLHQETNREYYNGLLNYVPKLKLCCIEDNRGSTLKDIKGEKINPDCIFAYNHILPERLSKERIVINSPLAAKVCNNKIYTFRALKHHNTINLPKTYVIHNQKEFRRLIGHKEFKKGYVIKLIDGQEGKGVHVYAKNERKPIIRKIELLEERIIPKRIHMRYWDIRVFVINGRFIGGYLRESRGRVTNISQGAKAYKLGDNLSKKLKKPALGVVRAIDNYCQHLSKTL